jgi:hypothetical protein
MPKIAAKESDVDDLKELLPLAARACGYEVLYIDDDGGVSCRDGSHSYWWSPLTYDGDALRLAVTLGLDVFCRPAQWSECGRIGSAGQRELYRGADTYAATRRAIVRAAAAIGMAMK